MTRTVLPLLLAAGLFVLGISPWPVSAAECNWQMVKASYYGRESGNRTASGKFFDGTQWLVAHKSLAFGTQVRLSYRGESVTAPVEDRGPYIAGRTLDLSEAVARRLGTIAPGVVTLCMQVFVERRLAMRVLAFLLFTTSAVAAPICHPDANDMLRAFQHRGGVFVDLIDDPEGESWDQIQPDASG